ncbi:MAG: ParB N-terminal domain-containing protein [Chloroflexia bacterium]
MTTDQSTNRPPTTDMPVLRLLPIDALVLHEHADEKRVARLEARLRNDGFLKSPPIVAPIPDSDRYVVLDGANRTSAVRNIGCPHLLVQVVDYSSDQVELTTWYHLITGRAPETFLAEIRAVDGLVAHRASIADARRQLLARSILSYVAIPRSEQGDKTTVYIVSGAHEAPGAAKDPTTMLNGMVDTYKTDPQVSIHRVNTDNIEDLMALYDGVSGLVVFPPYKPEDIMDLAEVGKYVPTGITRHIISHRALRVNVPMTLLCSDAPLEEKNDWWHEQIKRKLALNQIRLYQESTYLFDE